MNAQTKTLFESLERDYCPTIDSSLIAALVAEIESDAGGNAITPTQEQVDGLRATLSALSLQAEESEFSELSDMQLTSQFEETISSWTTADNVPEQPGSGSGESSSSHSFSSPLGFLQAALPEVSTARLNKALKEADGDGAEMWDIVASILTEESIRELEERGLDGLEEDERSLNESYDDEGDWDTVDNKKKATHSKTAKRKAQPRAKKIALVDIRQRHHQVQAHHMHHRNDNADNGHSSHTLVADPWTQISSLSDHVASLIPPHPPSTFQSFFHSPKYSTSYDALRAVLTSLCQNYKDPPGSDSHTTVIFNLLDLVLPQYEISDQEHRTRIIEDVQLAVAVTKGAGDEALQLIDLLRELDSNADMGVYHQLPPDPQAWKRDTETPSISRIRLPSSPPAIQPPPPRAKPKPPPSSSTRNKPSPYQWQAVPQRKPVPEGPHSLSHHIPAYTRDVNGMKTPRAFGSKGGKVDPETTEFRRRVDETVRKRNEALREASRMWQKGNSKTRGGEIAFYFAERAREFQEVARQEALNAARVLVQSQRVNSGNSDTIDLHGTTVAEAITIVKEILNDESSSISQAKPMKIITGRGKHSVNQVGVLKPAVKKALVEDGWVVGSWDGGLIVRQRRK